MRAGNVLNSFVTERSQPGQQGRELTWRTGELFIENDFGRYPIGSTTDGLKTGADGSITIVIQHQQPDDTANWLPAPATGPFNLTVRMYGAQTPVLEGSYRLPPVTKTK
jgi:hypothetical protein